MGMALITRTSTLDLEVEDPAQHQAVDHRPHRANVVGFGPFNAPLAGERPAEYIAAANDDGYFNPQAFKLRISSAMCSRIRGRSSHRAYRIWLLRSAEQDSIVSHGGQSSRPFRWRVPLDELRPFLYPADEKFDLLGGCAREVTTAEIVSVISSSLSGKRGSAPKRCANSLVLWPCSRMSTAADRACS